MASTAFTGPLLAGNVLQSDGTGNLAGVGGSSGTANIGFVQMAQSQAVTQATNGSSAGVFTTTIVIPAQSQIVDIYLSVTAAWSGSATLNIGSTTSATAFVNVAPNASLVVGQFKATPQTGSGALTQVNNWLNVSNTQDVQIVLTSSATGTGTGTLTVCYVQAINGFTAGSYT